MPRGTGRPGLPTSPRSSSGASRTFSPSVTPIASGSARPDSSTLSSCPLMPPERQKIRSASVRVTGFSALRAARSAFSHFSWVLPA